MDLLFSIDIVYYIYIFFIIYFIVTVCTGTVSFCLMQFLIVCLAAYTVVVIIIMCITFFFQCIAQLSVSEYFCLIFNVYCSNISFWYFAWYTISRVATVALTILLKVVGSYMLHFKFILYINNTTPKPVN